MSFALGTHQDPASHKWCWFVIEVDLVSSTTGAIERSDYKFLTGERAEAEAKRQMRLRADRSDTSEPP